MSQPLLDLQSSGVWSQIYNEQRDAVQVADNFWSPLPAFEIGFLLEKHVLAVRCLSTTAKPHWRFAGTLSQRFQIGTGGVVSPLPTVTGSARRLRLNRTELIRFPKLTTNYELLFEPPHWLKDLRLTIWEYNGFDSDTTEEMLTKIEEKIDVIGNWGGT